MMLKDNFDGTFSIVAPCSFEKPKPLSDEEIWNWFKENTALTKESALRIARAIEERHGIK